MTDDERTKRWAVSGPLSYSVDVILEPEKSDEEKSADETRAETILYNMGYSEAGTLEENLIAFQRDFQLFPADGNLDDRTRDALFEIDDDMLSKDEFLERYSQSDG